MEADKIIEEMTRRITGNFLPEKIILFGSRASGCGAIDSDVDLLIIVEKTRNKRELRLDIRRALNGMGLAKDIVVMTKEEFQIKRNIPGTIAYSADREGKILYAH